MRTAGLVIGIVLIALGLGIIYKDNGFVLIDFIFAIVFIIVGGFLLQKYIKDRKKA